MSYIQVKKDGLPYEAEYFYEDGMVTVFGVRGGQPSVDPNGMIETAAVRTTLRDFTRENKVGPLSE